MPNIIDSLYQGWRGGILGIPDGSRPHRRHRTEHRRAKNPLTAGGSQAEKDATRAIRDGEKEGIRFRRRNRALQRPKTAARLFVTKRD